MSHPIYACVICGYAIDGPSTPFWQKEFRAVWTHIHRGVYLTDKSNYDSWTGTWIPLQPLMRVINPEFPDVPVPDSAQIPVMKDRPNGNIERDMHGYVFHDACLNLLEEATVPRTVDPYRLYWICRSLPFPGRSIGVSWGHDYGGLSEIDLENQHHYSWEDRFIKQHKESEILQYADSNPYWIDELHDCLSANRDPDSQPKYLEWAGTDSRNCFSALPWEIRETIARYLPINDVLSLAKSSKAFLPILSDQTYWASVFDYDAECDFLFEAPLIRDFREIDWIAIYKRTMYLKDIPGLENRKRIWTIVKEIAKLLELYPPFRNPNYDGDDCTFVDEIDDWWEVEDQDPGLRKWKVEADIKPTALRNEWFYEGCRLLYEQVAPIPEDLVSIAFSIAVDGNTEYLAGIRFISEDGSSTQLGYRNMYKELYHEVTALKGFIIAIGSRGFHGLRVLGADGSISRWFGSPKDSPVTERLDDIDSAPVLKIGFDGYKIVDLGLVVLDRTDYDHDVAPFELRKAALWYPAVPASNLFLNDQSFTGEHPFAITYQPLCYIHFGGPNGIHLRTLTEIRVYAISDMLEIDFQYEANATQPIETQRLGRIDIEDFSDFVQAFSIDGPGGEIIQSVAVSVKRTKREDAYSFERHGKLDSFKITTNRGRSVHFQPPSRLNDGGTSSPLTPMAIEPGTTITGLYGSQRKPMAGLINLGVISEVIH